MTECYRCGVSDERERLFDAVSNRGVVKICKSCANEDSLPLVQPMDLSKPEKTKTVYERLSAMANLDPQKHRQMVNEREKEDSMRRSRLDFDRKKRTSLNDITEANLQKNKPQPRTDLVNNFHWTIMRARRAKKLTQKQLAENIGELESVIKNAEEGTILDNADSLIMKLETYLGVKLRKEDAAKREIREKFEREANFDPATVENLTISDLQEIKKKKESENPGGFFSFFKRNKKEEAKPEEKNELSGEEAEDVSLKG